MIILNYHQILNTILFNRNIIIKITGLSVVFIFLILFFIYPFSYESTVTVLPPEKNSQIGELGSLLGSNTDIASLLSGGSSGTSSQLYVEILKSRTAAEYVSKKNNLIDFYHADDLEEAVDKLQKHLNIELNKEGIILLNINVSPGLFSLFTNDREKLKLLSASLSNSYIEALDRINRDKLTSKAKKAREYIETQIVKTKFTLDSVETSLMIFQKLNKAISLPEQVKAAIDAAVKIRGEIASTEVELGILQVNLKEDNRTFIALKSKLEQLKEQYDKMEMGNQDYLVSFNDVPKLGRELASLIREVKIQNEVYLLLQQQYYKEKIQENRDLPTVEILDKAIPPKKPVGPKLLLAPLIGGVFVFMCVSLVFIYSEQRKMKS